MDNFGHNTAFFMVLAVHLLTSKITCLWHDVILDENALCVIIDQIF